MYIILAKTIIFKRKVLKYSLLSCLPKGIVRPWRARNPKGRPLTDAPVTQRGRVDGSRRPPPRRSVFLGLPALLLPWPGRPHPSAALHSGHHRDGPCRGLGKGSISLQILAPWQAVCSRSCGSHAWWRTELSPESHRKLVPSALLNGRQPHTPRRYLVCPRQRLPVSVPKLLDREGRERRPRVRPLLGRPVALGVFFLTCKKVLMWATGCMQIFNVHSYVQRFSVCPNLPTLVQDLRTESEETDETLALEGLKYWWGGSGGDDSPAAKCRVGRGCSDVRGVVARLLR